MAEKIKKTVSPFIIIALIVVAVIIVFEVNNPVAEADNLGTSVTVGNVAPSFTAVTDDSSTSGSPTNSGSDVTFTATATDSNGDQWKLLVCKTAGVSGTDCDGGEGDRWCVSSLVNSGTETSCSYTTGDGDAPSQDWHSYACDSTGCSSAETTNSPFYVNRRPSFTAYQDDAPKDPATTVTWTTTASDADSDDVTLYVCKTASFTAPSTCNGGEWCHSSAGASNPTCNTTTPRPDGDYEAYGYVVDEHGFEASGGSHGTDSTLTVSNVAPSITNTTIDLLDTDESGTLTLTTAQDETTGFLVKFIVTDNNSCQNISSGNEISSALIHVRMSELAQSSCDGDDSDNPNNCYQNAQTGTSGTCVQDTSVDTCTGDTDTTVGWRCEFPLQYHADPTTGTPTPQKDAYTWTVAVQATDDDSVTSALVDDDDGNELGLFMAYSVTEGSIGYGGPLAPEDDSSEQTTTVVATGNVGLDAEYSGTDMTSNGYTIVAGQQKYDFTSSVGWDSMTYALTNSASEKELNCQKTTTTASPASKATYWVLRIPSGQESGSYTGTNTITGVTGESGDW